MDEKLEILRKVLLNFISLNNMEWSLFKNNVDVYSVKKGDIIINEGTSADKVFVVLEGLVRIYFTRQDGEEKTFYFAAEGEFATDYESTLRGLPSKYSIDALEDSVIVAISAASLQELFVTLKEGDKLGRSIVEKYFFIWSERIADFYMHTPIERYHNMCRDYPYIIQRVPQYYIASYLNISTVHLSRIKSGSLISNQE